jgi:hypothetical protein
MIEDMVNKVLKIENCPHCGNPWHSDRSIKEILSKEFSWGTSYELVRTAFDFGWTKRNELRLPKVKFLFSPDPDFEDENYYMCPDCETMWVLATDTMLTDHEKSMILAHFSAQTSYYEIHP